MKLILAKILFLIYKKKITEIYDQKLKPCYYNISFVIHFHIMSKLCVRIKFFKVFYNFCMKITLSLNL